jgi:hypothetical protein
MSDVEDPRLVAAVQLVERMGALEFQIRYDDNEGSGPVVWNALARFRVVTGRRGARLLERVPERTDGAFAVHENHWEVAAAMAPLGAVLRLADQLMDGGTCTHCGKPTGVTHDPDEMPLGDYVCWYQFDPELAVYRRGCE